MNLCNSSITPQNSMCGSVEGGIKSVEIVEVVNDFLKSIPDSYGDYVDYYYRRGRNLFFRSEMNEVFRLTISTDIKEKLLPSIKRGQRFMLALK